MATRPLLYVFLLISIHASSQTSPLDPFSFGVVLDHPDMKKVKLKPDVTYLKDPKGSLNLDVYMPPGLSANDKRPAIIFLNAIGEQPGERKVKSWGIYTSWPQLMAANGYIGISMEADGSRIQESIKGVFDFIAEKGKLYNIDTGKLGVYAASANVTQSVAYLMKESAYPGIKAAALYYGGAPEGPFRKDLPVLFIISESDVQRSGYQNLWNEVLKNNAPWTIKMGTAMPHSFDSYLYNDESRKIIKETISFWKNHLDPVPQPSWPPSNAREIFLLLHSDPAKAATLLKSWTSKYPTDKMTLSFYASALRQTKQYDEAEAQYKKILSLASGDIETIVALASLNYTQNKIEEAEKYVSIAVNSGKMNRTSYSQLAFSLLVDGKDKEAAKYYEQAIAIEPRSNDVYNLACAYAKMNEKDKALEALERSVKMGYGTRQFFENDADLNPIKTDERFKKIVENMK
jgi:tetratricopeptide (TPR) repeat protein